MFDHREEHVDENMLLLQANVDDMNPEMCPYVSERLFELGANDVWWIPIIMKKGRPGIMLNVLVDRGKLEAVKETIFRETTTLGLRYAPMTCHRLGRETVQVETPWGQVPVKIGRCKGETVQFAPEYKDCERIAKQYGIPLKNVYDEVRAAYLKRP